MDEMEEMIGRIFAAKTLHECGCCLEEFARRMGDISDPGVMEDVSDYFWERLARQSVLNLDFDDPENRGWMICPPELQVPTYLDISLIPRATAEEDVTYLLETGREMQRDFDGIPHSSLTAEGFQTVLSFLDEKYGYSTLVLNHQKAIAMFFPEARNVEGNQSIYRYYRERSLLCPHFPFFAITNVDYFMGLLVSPAYRLLYELFIAMVNAAFAAYVDDGRLEYIIPPEIVRLTAEDGYHASFEEKDPHSQAHDLVMDITNAILSDSPFPAPMMEETMKRNPEQYRCCRKILEAVLDVLRKKREGGCP